MSNVLKFEEAVASDVSMEAAPVCLYPPWMENPYRPVSLWDIVIQFSGEKLFWSGYALESLKTDCLMKPGPGDIPFQTGTLYKEIDAATKETALDWLRRVREACERVSLSVSVETIAEMEQNISDETSLRPYQWLMSQIDSLQKLIQKEMKSKAFFYIAPEKLRFWITQKNPYPMGVAAHDAFQSAELDAAEAGICLAVARPTASVFHSMRVLEVGLSTLGKVFNVSLAHTNWGPAIDEIEKHIRDMHKDPVWKVLPDCKEQQEFYAQAASHFGILKVAWRNYTAHKRGTYTEERATLIFENVRAFMHTLATRLHE